MVSRWVLEQRDFFIAQRIAELFTGVKGDGRAIVAPENTRKLKRVKPKRTSA